MHIGFIEDTDLHGGTQIWVTEAARDFISKGHDVTILTSKSGWVAEVCKDTAARVAGYDYDAVVAEDDENIAIWSDALKDCDVAICTVHPPRDSFHCSVFAAKCIKQSRLKTILVPKTGTIVPEYKRQFYQPDDDINCRVIAITDFTRKALIETYNIDSGKVDLVYQGTEVELFTSSSQREAEAKERYPLGDGAWPVLGSVGSFEHRKGQVVLLEALCKVVAGQFPNAHLMLVGDGPDEEMLKEKTKELGLENNVTFFPFTREPVYIFEVLDILTLPSLYKEGLPNVLLEAMSMGVPVVASRMAGVPEIVKEGVTGYMTEPGDVDQLAEKIALLASDKDAYGKMRVNCRQLMEGSFDKRRQFDDFLRYFERIIP
jgi:glycosyltransferase involved in cell wall biosynthesis